MTEKITPFQEPVGTHDVWGAEGAKWEALVAIFSQRAFRYGFSLVLTPLFEDVGVFLRGIGGESDVVTKEMYVFTDRGDRRYALRPEGTAPVVRAFVQHRPTTPWKAWYLAPVFRYERPQKGRYRQHYQLGVEVLGTDDPAIDVEVIALAHGFYRDIGLRRVRLLINSMGHDGCRVPYVESLRAHLASHAGELRDEHATTWSTSPLRVLDCKDPACVAVTESGPMLINQLCSACRDHFELVCAGLAAIGIEFDLAPRLVRGFDYYTRTTFEFAADTLHSAQNAIGGGGRYDKLAEQLGGAPTGGIGFGSGVERLLIARELEGLDTPLLARTLDVFVVDPTGRDEATTLVEELRRANLATDRCYDGRSLKAQMKVADRSGARLVVLLGTDDRTDGAVSIRDLRSHDYDQAQTRVERREIVATVTRLLSQT